MLAGSAGLGWIGRLALAVFGNDRGRKIAATGALPRGDTIATGRGTGTAAATATVSRFGNTDGALSAFVIVAAGDGGLAGRAIEAGVVGDAPSVVRMTAG